nr:hypothetical protein [Arenimonas sp.]
MTQPGHFFDYGSQDLRFAGGFLGRCFFGRSGFLGRLFLHGNLHRGFLGGIGTGIALAGNIAFAFCG